MNIVKLKFDPRKGSYVLFINELLANQALDTPIFFMTKKDEPLGQMIMQGRDVHVSMTTPHALYVKTELINFDKVLIDVKGFIQYQGIVSTNEMHRVTSKEGIFVPESYVVTEDGKTRVIETYFSGGAGTVCFGCDGIIEYEAFWTRSQVLSLQGESIYGKCGTFEAMHHNMEATGGELRFTRDEAAEQNAEFLIGHDATFKAKTDVHIDAFLNHQDKKPSKGEYRPHITIEGENHVTVEGLINLAKSELHLRCKHNTPQLNADQSAPAETILEKMPDWFDFESVDLTQFTLGEPITLYLAKSTDIKKFVLGFSKHTQYRTESVGDGLVKLNIVPVYHERLHIDMSADIVGTLDAGVVRIGDEMTLFGQSYSDLENMAKAISSEPSYEIIWNKESKCYQMNIVPIYRNEELAMRVKKLKLGEAKTLSCQRTVAAHDIKALASTFDSISGVVLAKGEKLEGGGVSAHIIQPLEASEFDGDFVIHSSDTSKARSDIYEMIERLRAAGIKPGFAGVTIEEEFKYPGAEGAKVTISGGSAAFTRPTTGVVHFNLDVKNMAHFGMEAFTDALETMKICAHNMHVNSMISAGRLLHAKVEHTRIKSTGTAFSGGDAAFEGTTMINGNQVVAGRNLSIKMDAYFINLWNMRARNIYVCSSGYFNIGLVTASQSIRIESLVAVSVGIHRAWQISVVSLFSAMGIMVPYADKDTEFFRSSQLLMGALYSLQYVCKAIPVGLIISVGMAAFTAAMGIKNLIEKTKKGEESIRFFDILPIIAGLANAAPMTAKLLGHNTMDKIKHASKTADFIMNPLQGLFSMATESGGLGGWFDRLGNIAKIPLTILGPSVREVNFAGVPSAALGFAMHIDASVFMAHYLPSLGLSEQILAYHMRYGGFNMAANLSMTASDAHIDAGVTIADNADIHFPHIADNTSDHHTFAAYNANLDDPFMTADQAQEFLNGMAGKMHYTNMHLRTDMKFKDPDLHAPKGHHGSMDAAGLRFTANGTKHARQLADEAKAREDAQDKKDAEEHKNDKHPDDNKKPGADDKKTADDKKNQEQLDKAKGQAAQQKPKEPPKLTQEEADRRYEEIKAEESTRSTHDDYDGETGTMNYSTHHNDGDQYSGLIVVDSNAAVYSGEELSFNAATNFAMYENALLKGGKGGVHVFAQMYAYCYGATIRSRGFNIFAGLHGTLVKDVAHKIVNDTANHPGHKSPWGKFKNWLNDKLSRKVDITWNVTQAQIIGAASVVGDTHSDTIIQAAEVAAGHLVLQGHVLDLPPEDLVESHSSRGFGHWGYHNDSSTGNKVIPTTVASDDLTLRAKYADIHNAKIQTNHLHLMIKNQLAATMVLTWYASKHTGLSINPKNMIKQLWSDVKHLPKSFVNSFPVLSQMAKASEAPDSHERLTRLWNAGTGIEDLGKMMAAGTPAALASGAGVGVEVAGFDHSHTYSERTDGAQIEAKTIDGHVGSMHMESAHVHADDASGLKVDRDVEMVDGHQLQRSRGFHAGLSVGVSMAGVGVTGTAAVSQSSDLSTVKSEFTEGKDNHTPSAKVGGRWVHQQGSESQHKSSTRGVSAGASSATVINRTQDHDTSVVLPFSMLPDDKPEKTDPLYEAVKGEMAQMLDPEGKLSLHHTDPTQASAAADDAAQAASAASTHEAQPEPNAGAGRAMPEHRGQAPTQDAAADHSATSDLGTPEHHHASETEAWLKQAEEYLDHHESDAIDHVIAHFIEHVALGVANASVLNETFSGIKEVLGTLHLEHFLDELTPVERNRIEDVLTSMKAVIENSAENLSPELRSEACHVLDALEKVLNCAGDHAAFQKCLDEFSLKFAGVFSVAAFTREIKGVGLGLLAAIGLFTYELYHTPRDEWPKMMANLSLEVLATVRGSMAVTALAVPVCEANVRCYQVASILGGVIAGTVTHNLLKDAEKQYHHDGKVHDVISGSLTALVSKLSLDVDHAHRLVSDFKTSVLRLSDAARAEYKALLSHNRVQTEFYGLSRTPLNSKIFGLSYVDMLKAELESLKLNLSPLLANTAFHGVIEEYSKAAYQSMHDWLEAGSWHTCSFREFIYQHLNRSMVGSVGEGALSFASKLLHYGTIALMAEEVVNADHIDQGLHSAVFTLAGFGFSNHLIADLTANLSLSQVATFTSFGLGGLLSTSLMGLVSMHLPPEFSIGLMLNHAFKGVHDSQVLMDVAASIEESVDHAVSRMLSNALVSEAVHRGADGSKYQLFMDFEKVLQRQEFAKGYQEIVSHIESSLAELGRPMRAEVESLLHQLPKVDIDKFFGPNDVQALLNKLPEWFPHAWDNHIPQDMRRVIHEVLPNQFTDVIGAGFARNPLLSPSVLARQLFASVAAYTLAAGMGVYEIAHAPEGHRLEAFERIITEIGAGSAAQGLAEIIAAPLCRGKGYCIQGVGFAGNIAGQLLGRYGFDHFNLDAIWKGLSRPQEFMPFDALKHINLSAINPIASANAGTFDHPPQITADHDDGIAAATLGVVTQSAHDLGKSYDIYHEASAFAVDLKKQFSHTYFDLLQQNRALIEEKGVSETILHSRAYASMFGDSLVKYFRELDLELPPTIRTGLMSHFSEIFGTLANNVAELNTSVDSKNITHYHKEMEGLLSGSLLGEMGLKFLSVGSKALMGASFVMMGSALYDVDDPQAASREMIMSDQGAVIGFESAEVLLSKSVEFLQIGTRPLERLIVLLAGGLFGATTFSQFGFEMPSGVTASVVASEAWRSLLDVHELKSLSIELKSIIDDQIDTMHFFRHNTDLHFENQRLVGGRLLHRVDPRAVQFEMLQMRREFIKTIQSVHEAFERTAVRLSPITRAELNQIIDSLPRPTTLHVAEVNDLMQPYFKSVWDRFPRGGYHLFGSQFFKDPAGHLQHFLHSAVRPGLTDESVMLSPRRIAWRMGGAIFNTTITIGLMAYEYHTAPPGHKLQALVRMLAVIGGGNLTAGAAMALSAPLCRNLPMCYRAVGLVANIAGAYATHRALPPATAFWNPNGEHHREHDYEQQPRN